jgi:hypothetical protein
MISRLVPAMSLLAAAPLMAGIRDSDDVARSLDGTQWAQLTVRERIVIRVPRLDPRAGRDAPAQPVPIQWKEKKGPKCVPIAALRGAAFGRDDGVDFVLAGNRRVRAKLEDDCPALDFYSGFYLKPTADGQVCADRDSIRSRSGAVCPIDRFRTLVPNH